jgi:hypothetical protein
LPLEALEGQGYERFHFPHGEEAARAERHSTPKGHQVLPGQGAPCFTHESVKLEHLGVGKDVGVAVHQGRKNTEFSVDGNVRLKPFLPSTWRITIEPEVSRRDSSTQLSRTSSSSSCGKHSASLEFDFVCTLLISSVTA